MRITVKPSKRVAAPHPQVASLISLILSTPNEEIANIFEPITSCKWPRSDLHSWINVLNKLDEIYEQIIQDYDIEKLQINEFTPSSKRTLLQILKFERLLLENSTNRKLFNSYDRLNSLLFTSDVEVLLVTLQLILRPAQQYSAQPSVSQALRISTNRLQVLAKQWPSLHEQGITLADIASQAGEDITRIESLPVECSDVNLTFYRRQQPAQEGATISGPSAIHLGAMANAAELPFKILADAIEKYDVPPDEQFDLLCRIRVGWALGKGRAIERAKLLVVRLLSIAIYSHTHPESDAQTTVFLYEPDLVGHISELLQLGRDIPLPVRTAALAALDAAARYRGKIQDVLAGVNAGVNHGVLMSLLRRTISDMSRSDRDVPQSFAEGLLTFISYLATHTAGGNMVIGAGLIPLLIQISENRLPSRLSVVSKTMTLIDNILYGYPNAFQIFVAANGVDVMVARIEYEVNYDLQDVSPLPDEGGSQSGSLPIMRSALLKHLLRSVHRMMHSSGTSEGLRGLIDSSLVRSIKRIIENRTVFGATVLPLAINVMTTFIHNEPTSLPIIQETGLPQAFYAVIESGLEPSIEVLQSVPNAIGALCLNQAGVDQLAAKPTVIPSFFGVFTSQKHVKVLQDKDNAAVIGGAIDELVRHHPSLNAQIFEALAQTLESIEILGNAYAEPSGTKHLYRLISDVSIGKSEATSHAPEITASPEISPEGANEPMEEDEKSTVTSGKTENEVIGCLEVFSRFLEGLFQHVQHCRDFINKSDGLTRLGRLIALPCLPYDFAVSLGSDALVQVVRTMVEVSPSTTLLALAKQVQSSLEATESFWRHAGESSLLFNLVEPTSPEALSDANAHFRDLITLHTRVALLSEVCQSAGYPQGRAVNSVLQALTSSEVADVIPNLGALHRYCIWENLMLKNKLHDRNATIQEPDFAISSNVLTVDDKTASVPIVEATDAAGARPSVSSNQDVAPGAGLPEDNIDSANLNAKALSHLMNELPNTLTSMFQVMVKMFLFSRRNPDASQRKQVTQTANVMAEVLLSHLTLIDSEADLAVYAYDTLMISFIDMLLFDERTSQNSLHTSLLLAFIRKSGLDAILHICDMSSTAITRISAIAVQARSEYDSTELLRALSCLTVTLRLLHSLVSARPLLESGQTTFLTTPGKKPSEPDYFEPHDFLCRTRATVLPFLEVLWRSSWISTVGGVICKEVIHTLLEILTEAGEDRAGATSGVDTLMADLRSHRPEPDEDRIRQLCDMGFPRSAVERALQRTNNNVNAATEYLLAHPLPFPPDPVSTLAPEDSNLSIPAALEQEVTSAHVPSHAPESGNMEITSEQQMEASDPKEGAVVIKPLEEVRQHLDVSRSTLKEDFGRLCLRLLDSQPGLIFDVKPAFVGLGWKEQGLRAIFEDIRGFSPSAHDIHEDSLAIRCRLLALILSETTSSLREPDYKALMDHLLALLLANPITANSESQSAPKWLASHLLVTHALLIKGEEPREVSLPSSQEPIRNEELFTGPKFTEPRPILFDACMRLISLSDLSSNDLLACLRLLVHLTRDPILATEFYQRNGVSSLLDKIQMSEGQDTVNIQLYLVILLRHILEDTTVLEATMRGEIARRFSQPRTRVLDIGAFTRHCAPIILRDPGVFIKVSSSICELVPTHPTLQHITLKSTAPSQQDLPASEEASVQLDRLPVSVLNHAEILINLLIGELLRVGKRAVEYALDPTSEIHNGSSTNPIDLDTTFSKDSEQGTSESQLSKSKRQSDFAYACFLLQCMTELLFSYDNCKAAFMSYNRRRTGSQPKDKHRPSILSFLLTDIISQSNLVRQDLSNSRRRTLLTNWGMGVLMALCVDTKCNADAKDPLAEITMVRKFVLEGLNKGLKDCASSNPPEAQYGKLLSLADLTHRLLSMKSNFGPHKERDETPLYLAKMMLEKNFVATLTTALADIDINYPGARGLINSVLRPLEQLTKVAIKMGRPPEKSTHTPGSPRQSHEDVSSEEDEPTLRDVHREEATDLYRHSALGMYGGEMEDMTIENEDDDMVDEDEDGDGDEMDFDDVETDSENTSDDDMDGTEGEEEIVHEGSGETAVWQNGVEDMAESGDSDADEDGVHDIDPAGDAHHGMWQDLPNTEDFANDEGGEDMEEAEGITGIPIADEEDEDDGVDGDDEDLNDDLELLEGDDDVGALPQHHFDRMFGHWFTPPSGRPSGLAPRDMLFPRPTTRRRLPGDEIHHSLFGRQGAVSEPGMEPTNHPLLVEMRSPNASPSGHSGDNGNNTRGTTDRLYGDLVASLSDLVGGGALQILQQLLSRGSAGAEIVGLEVPSAGLVATVDRNGHILRQTRLSGMPSRPSREQGEEGDNFSPLPTLMRWSDEAKITNGAFFAERPSKFGNHLVLALLPAARQAAKEAEAAEQQRKSELEAKMQEQTSENSTLEAIAPQESDAEMPTDHPETSETSERVEMDSAMTIDVVQPTVPVTEAQLVDNTAQAMEGITVADDHPAGVDERRVVTPVPLGVAPPTAVQEASTSEAAVNSSTPGRTVVLIHGSPVDITNTGIDPTFLEALPDDMREEVLNQHFREQRNAAAAARAPRPADSHISSEFLDALPPEIRAELLDQEAEQARRAQVHIVQNDQDGSTGPVEMDSASFLATLDPQLRQVVLLEQDENFLQTLPSALLAEAGAYREAVQHRIQDVRLSRDAANSHPPASAKPAVHRDSIHLLDRAGIAILVRLLFHPQVLRKNTLLKVLVNLCENGKARTELYNLLISILHDAANPSPPVDKNVTQSSQRTPRQILLSPSKPSSKPKPIAGPDGYSSVLVESTTTSDTALNPKLVIQRCIEALTDIVSANEASPLFFLCEQEQPSTLRKGVSKKGKGKEKQTPLNYYPITVLLSLLDQNSLLKTPAMMDPLVALLAIVTRPLETLPTATSQVGNGQPSAHGVLSQATSIPLAEAGGGSGPLPAVTENHDNTTVESEKTQPSGESGDPTALSRLREPPYISTSIMKLVVNILTAGECSGKTFQHCLQLIQHLAPVPDAQDIIASELKNRAQELATDIFTSLDELASMLTLQEERVDAELPAQLAAKFSSPAADQAKLLRLLKTIDYMFTTKQSSSENSGDVNPLESAATETSKANTMYASLDFGLVWDRLGDCLKIMQERPDVESLATVLLPLIEALMVVCKHVGNRRPASTEVPGSPKLPSFNEARGDLFVAFTDAHRKVLNLMVRNNPSLMSGSFSLLINNSRVLDFDNKRNYFTQQLRRRPHAREHHTTLQLNVRRSRVFEDSFQYLQRKSGDQIKYGKLSIRFYDEEGVDAGGLTREWFTILARQMFNPDYALFEPCAADESTYQPNRASSVNPEHLSFFKFVGRIIGKAIFDGRLLDAYFARSLYRQLLGKPVDYRDVEWVDPEYYKSLIWILENDPSPLDLTFIVEDSEFGVTNIVPLKENGASLTVTQDNKREYVQLSAEYRLVKSIRDQIDALLNGFYEIIPKDLISIFNEQEVELLISGTPDVDVDEWRAATDYNGYSSSDPVISWWWRALKSFSREERAKLLSFATGTARVPLGGFVELQGVQGVQRFSIHKAYGDVDRLPQAHTCFNQIDLPEYSSYEKLRTQLLLAINEGSTGFGFA